MKTERWKQWPKEHLEESQEINLEMLKMLRIEWK